MIRAPCEWLDRLAINYAAACMPVPDGRDLHLAEAETLLARADFFPTNTTPAAIEFSDPIHFQFPSPRPSKNPVNDLVKGRFYRCGDQWQKKPLVLLLHGWNDRLNHYYFFPRHARRFNQLGLNAATLQMPWQFGRRPRDLGAWGNILSADALHTINAILQALADIRAFVNWAFAQRCPFVGLWGVSMGAWFSGLTISYDERIGCAVLTVPVPRLDALIEKAAFCQTIRTTLKDHPLDLARLNLTSRRPIPEVKNILLIEAEYDLFVPKECVEELQSVWNGPELWRYRTGHISVLWARGFSAGAAQWIAARALK
jgi:pimeloyl-ACP methyl ester carboxylesterase